MNHKLPRIDNEFKAPESNEGVVRWLQDNASKERSNLLAFADDGVIWGVYDGGLKTAPDSFDSELRPELNGETLQQAFLFGKNEELRLFRGANGDWRACLITDVDGQHVIDESQLLWGNKVEGQPLGGFTHVRDRVQQAMDHVLPLDLSGLDLNQESPRLLVRHFIDYDNETGEARIFLSRLVKLGTGPIAEEVMK
jgi:CRISPR-associated protein (TIGR03984 family)